MTRSTRGRATRIPSRIRSRAWTLRNLSNFQRLQFLRELARVVLAPKHQTWLVGQDDPDLLVWRAPSTLMNPSLKPARLERERRLDAVRFAREYAAEFVDDVAAFLPGVWIDDAIVYGRYELSPQPNVSYVAGFDPSGGGKDAFTLAIVHSDSSDEVVLNVIKGNPSPARLLGLE